MSAQEKISGVEISTYGLRLTKFENHVQLPPYKNILEENDMSEEMRILDEANVEVELTGKYASKSALTTGIGNFQAKIKSQLVQLWYFGNLNFNQYCVVKKGMAVVIHRGNIAVVRFTLTVTSNV
jgi:hypothetical protein